MNLLFCLLVSLSYCVYVFFLYICLFIRTICFLQSVFNNLFSASLSASLPSPLLGCLSIFYLSNHFYISLQVCCLCVTQLIYDCKLWHVFVCVYTSLSINLSVILDWWIDWCTKISISVCLCVSSFYQSHGQSVFQCTYIFLCQ